MPEIRIRYDDDSDRMPYAAISEVIAAAAQHLPVNDFEWIRDDDLDEDEPDEITYSIRPDVSGLTLPDLSAFTSAFRPKGTR